MVTKSFVGDDVGTRITVQNFVTIRTEVLLPTLACGNAYNVTGE